MIFFKDFFPDIDRAFDCNSNEASGDAVDFDQDRRYYPDYDDSGVSADTNGKEKKGMALRQRKKRNGLTVVRNKNGESYKIRFCVSGVRKKIHLPQCYTYQQADKIADRVQELAAACNSRAKPEPDLQAWLENLSDDLRQKLEGVDLIEPSKQVTCGELWCLYLKQCECKTKTGELKDSTVTAYETALTSVCRFFNADKQADEVTAAECESFKNWLITKGNNGKPYAKATVARTLKRCRTVWSWAVENEYCEENPFKKVSIPSMVNDKKLYFIEPETYLKLLDACTDQQLRVYLALLRYGGLRASEPKYLTWDDVLWGTDGQPGRLLVHSKKTEHHEGHKERWIPLWPEIRVELEALFEQAEPGGSPYILPLLQEVTMQAVRHRVERVIKHAGLVQWPRLFQNLRASRDTELSAKNPAHLVARWLGHSPEVSFRHYLMQRDDDFIQAATQWSIPNGEAILSHKQQPETLRGQNRGQIFGNEPALTGLNGNG